MSATATPAPVLPIDAFVRRTARAFNPRARNANQIRVAAEALIVKQANGEIVSAADFDKILGTYMRLAVFTAPLTEKGLDGHDAIIGLGDAVGLHQRAGIRIGAGSQIRYTSAPQKNLHEISTVLDAHLHALAEAAHEHGHLVTMPGLHPLYAGEKIPMSGRQDVALMARLAARQSGRDGLVTMCGATSVKYLFNTPSPKEWARYYRAATALQLVVGALTSNSPFKAGEATGDESHRSRLFQTWGNNWAQDIARVIFSADFSLSKLIAFTADKLPLPYLTRHNNKGEVVYWETKGRTLKSLLTARPAEIGRIHERDVQTMFDLSFLPVTPEGNGALRLSGTDGPYPLRFALGAFLTGILYDKQALQKAEEKLSFINPETYNRLSNGVARSGLKALLPDGRTVRELAKELLEVAEGGLARRGFNEQPLLEPLTDIAHCRKNAEGHRADTPGKELHENAVTLGFKIHDLSRAVELAFLKAAIPFGERETANPDIPEQQPSAAQAFTHAL